MESKLPTTLSNFFKSSFTVAALIILILTTLAPATAKANDGEIAIPIEIKYVGAINSQPAFHIEFANPEKEELFFSLKDSDGSFIYSERIKAEKFSKTFQFDKPEGDMAVTVTISSKKGKKIQVLQINKSSRFVEEVKVTQIK